MPRAINVFASEADQYLLFLRGSMDCFASLAMTTEKYDPAFQQRDALSSGKICK
jgi:hypothetical protein